MTGKNLSPNNFTLPLKFRKKVLPLVRRILKLLARGHYPANIGRQLGKDKAHIHYYVKKLQKLGLIEKLESWQVFEKGIQVPVQRGAATFYRVTQIGENFLAAIERGVFERRLRLHNAYWLFRILRAERMPVDWRRVEMTNWTQLLGREMGLTVRKNANRSIEIVTGVVDGTNPWKMLFAAKDEAETLALHLEQKHDMILGRASLSRKPHFGIYDPVANTFSKFFQLSTEDAKIDESETIGEIDWLSPDAAEDYLLMPKDVQQLKLVLDDIKTDVKTFQEGLDKLGPTLGMITENLKLHLAVIEEYREESIGRQAQTDKSTEAFLQAVGQLTSVVNRLDMRVALKGKKRFPWEV